MHNTCIYGQGKLCLVNKIARQGMIQLKQLTHAIDIIKWRWFVVLICIVYGYI